MQLPGLSIGVVADDMTGACDTALQFFSPTLETSVLLNRQPTAELADENPEYHVWSVVTASRHRQPLEAAALTRQATAMLKDRYSVVNFYKKIDSTLRGNIAHECLGMLEELKAQCAVIVPAYPEEGRRTVGGYQLVRGVPVERTSIARDPLSPVRQSHIPSMLVEACGDAALVGHISLSTVLHGAGPILVRLGELIKEGKKLVVVDATTTEDLDQIVLAIEKTQKSAKILPCGSAGLARSLTRYWGGASSSEEQDKTYVESENIVFPAGPTLIVSGSLTETTRLQVLQLIENYQYVGLHSTLEIFEIPADQLLGLADSATLVEQILAAMGDRNTILVSSALKEEHYRHTLQLAQEHEIPDERVAQLVQQRLTEVTRKLMEKRPSKLVLTGGETAYQVCDALGITRLKVVGRIEQAIPLCRDEQKRWIVTKSGGFGSPMTLANIVQYIKQRESAALHA